MGEKRINLAHPIRDKEVAVVLLACLVTTFNMSLQNLG